MTTIVGVTATTKILDGWPRVRLNDAYVRALTAAELVPLVIPPLDDADADAVLDAIGGLVLSGGEDVAPAEYGAPASPHTYPPHPGRDRCELALTRRAHERRVPTLAICRGLQVVNVAFGGTLVQDIPTELPNSLGHERPEQRGHRVHDVEIAEGSALARAVGRPRIAVNSSHHQAIARPAPGLDVVARASDGVIEGVEWTADDWWMLAVQWHPEELVGDDAPWDRNLFAAFARRVRGVPGPGRTGSG